MVLHVGDPRLLRFKSTTRCLLEPFGEKPFKVCGIMFQSSLLVWYSSGPHTGRGDDFPIQIDGRSLGENSILNSFEKALLPISSDLVLQRVLEKRQKEMST
jgi:hypothetical protein